MANTLGYESFYAGSGSLPTQQKLIKEATHVSAIFYVDPFGGPALYRGDGVKPTIGAGLPFQPGGHIILVGRTNIANAAWESMIPGEAARIHVVYYDQVDVVAANLIGRDASHKGDGALSHEVVNELRTLIAMLEYHWNLDRSAFKVG